MRRAIAPEGNHDAMPLPSQRFRAVAIAAAALLAPFAARAGGDWKAEVDASVDRAFARGDYAGIAYGIVTPDGLVHARAVGVADGATSAPLTLDHAFRIGSVTKVFTTTLLLALRDEGTVRLDDPLAEHWDGALPETSPLGAPAITLRHLAQHTSGLPRMPDNMTGRAEDPYNSYSPEQLREALAATGLDTPVGSNSAYSNFGMAVLGQALASASGMEYREALRAKVLVPMGLSHTGFAPEETGGAPWTRGHEAGRPRKPVDDWQLGAMEPAGSIASTVGDLARFLQAHFAPDTAEAAAARPYRWSTAREATSVSFIEDADWRGGLGIGWHITRHPDGVVVWHNGQVRNHASFVGFRPKERVGVIVLTNSAVSVDALAMELLGRAAKEIAAPVVEAPPPRVAAYAEAVLAAIGPEVSDEALAKLFTPEFLEAVPPIRVKSLFMTSDAMLKGIAGHEVVRAADGESWSLTVRGRSGVAFRYDFQVTATDPPRAVYFLAQPHR